MEEEWRAVKGLEGYYSVSDLGRVYTHRGKRLLRGGHSDDGYRRAVMQVDGRQKITFVHKMVMEAFVGESDLQVDHVDGCPWNNRLDNLEYVTRKENNARRGILNAQYGGGSRYEYWDRVKLARKHLKEEMKIPLKI